MNGLTSGSLREHFGDRKLPDISRKITACVACRKQKIKCHMQGSIPPCSRCKTRGLSCTVNKSLQMLLERDIDWKKAVDQRLANLEISMAQGAKVAPLESFVNPATTQLPAPEKTTIERVDSELPPHNEPDVRTWEIDENAIGGPAAIPASHLIERAQNDIGSQFNRNFDEYNLVTQGVVSLDRARELFRIYHDRFDHFLYRILGEDRSFESVLSSSPLLLSAICAVSALQTASPDFEKCYQAFLNVCATRAFSKDCTYEDVQAYCIGAFWLSDMSWNLVGAGESNKPPGIDMILMHDLAVRTATQLQLHRSIYKALEGDKVNYLRTRLFYLVYVCDHHFSILYGRLPMTGSHSDVIDSWRCFLGSKHACEDDARLVSQVHVWRIYSRVQDNFGTNVEALLPSETFPQIRSFVGELDAYRAEWNETFSHHPQIGNYPNQGLGLHHQFAKLFVSSHVFRARATIVCGMISELDEIVNISVTSATSILTSVASDENIQSYLNGLPSYFFTMITFASVFLLKVAQRYPGSPCIDKSKILRLVGKVVTALRHVSKTMHRRHLLTSIVYGLEKVLAQIPGNDSSAQHSTQTSSPENTDIVPQGDPEWFTSPSNASIWDNYDLLSFQDLPSDFDFDMEFQA
jgi:hypothetical protein